MTPNPLDALRKEIFFTLDRCAIKYALLHEEIEKVKHSNIFKLSEYEGQAHAYFDIYKQLINGQDMTEQQIHELMLREGTELLQGVREKGLQA